MPQFNSDPFFILLVAVILMFGSIVWLKLHAFIALLLSAFIVAMLTPGANIEQFALSGGMSSAEALALANSGIGERVARAFGNTTAQIGILIAMAAVIGKCLLESGGAERIVRSIIRLTGESKSPVAFTISSFFLAIPVFFDTVFYLMVPLAKAMAARMKKNYLLLILTIAAGGTMAHSLLPPTPGPLFLVAVMNIPIHMMMTGGFVVGIFAVLAGYLYAVWINKKLSIPLRDSPDVPIGQIEALVNKDIIQLPPLWLSVLPILVPVIFISTDGIINASGDFERAGSLLTGILAVVSFLGDKNTALIIGALISLFLLTKQKSGNREQISKSVQSALMSGGVIILITAAGGAWNASIIAEAISWGSIKLHATGLGVYITDAATSGNFSQVVFGTIVMCLFVILINRLIWRPLYNLAAKKFSLG